MISVAFLILNIFEMFLYEERFADLANQVKFILL